MSFAAETKQALCEIRIKKSCCRKALLLGILRAAYLFCSSEIRFTTRSRRTAALTGALLEEIYGIHTFSAAQPEESVYETDADGECEQILITGEDADRIVRSFPLTDAGRPAALPDSALFACPACEIAFIRGVFLSCGNVTDPGAYYHLDMVLYEDDMAEAFGYFLEEHGLAPKHTARKGMPVLYYKDSEAIEDFLTVIGAKKAAFAVMDAKILKDIRNNANRVSNCELANLGKTVDAATLQYEAIRDLMESDRFALLPVELQQTAKLRYEHPDLPLKDLAALHEPPLTKSGLNHRLRRIVDFDKTEE